MNETFEQFNGRISDIEYEKRYIVGRAHRGHTRDIFCFDGVYVHCETTGFGNIPRPGLSPRDAELRRKWDMLRAATTPINEWWVVERCWDKKTAKSIAKKYGADIDQEPYSDDDNPLYFLIFKDFDKMAKLLYDHKTGEFQENFNTNLLTRVGDAA
jgi:hypothetical protein